MTKKTKKKMAQFCYNTEEEGGESRHSCQVMTKTMLLPIKY